jgi:hypothetical protein
MIALGRPGMPLNVAIFEALCWGSAVAIFGFLLWQCVHQKRFTPLTVMAIAALSLAWLEGAFDWAQYGQFPPELPRIRPWGPLGMTAGGLPWIAVPGYVMYIATIVLLGFFYDLAFESLGALAGWWRFARGFEGVAICCGDKSLGVVTLPMSYLMALLYMVAAYLAGRADDKGLTPIEAWARRKTTSSAGATILNILMTILAMQFTYLWMLVPDVIANVFNLYTVAYTGEMFPGLPPQPGPPPPPPGSAAGWLGTLIIFLWLTVFLVGFLYLVRRFDPMARRQTVQQPALSMGG